MVSALIRATSSTPVGWHGDENFLLVGMVSMPGRRQYRHRRRRGPAARSDTVLVNFPHSGQPRAGRRGGVPRDLAIAEINAGVIPGPVTDPLRRAERWVPELGTRRPQLNSASLGGPKYSEGHSETVGLEHQPVHRVDFVVSRGWWALTAASRMQHHPVAGLRTGHGAGARQAPGH